MDNPIDNTLCQGSEEMMESEQDRQCFDKEFMKAYIEDLKERGRSLIFKIIKNEYTELSHNVFTDVSQIDKKFISKGQVTLRIIFPFTKKKREKKKVFLLNIKFS